MVFLYPASTSSPIGSMCGIFTYIWLICMVHVANIPVPWILWVMYHHSPPLNSPCMLPKSAETWRWNKPTQLIGLELAGWYVSGALGLIQTKLLRGHIAPTKIRANRNSTFFERENPAQNVGQNKQKSIAHCRYLHWISDSLLNYSCLPWQIHRNTHLLPSSTPSNSPTPLPKTEPPCAGEVNTLCPINSAPAWTCRACNIAKAKWTSRRWTGEVVGGWCPVKVGGFVRWGWKL